jgi:hypothetical protein
MSATERAQDVERVATVTPLPSRATPDPEPAVPAERTAPSLPSVPLPSASQIFDFVVPPDIWSDKRPSLRDLWLYGVYGRWTQASGPVRVLGALYASVIAMPFHAASYLANWVVERPARLFVAAIVAALIILAF